MKKQMTKKPQDKQLTPITFIDVSDLRPGLENYNLADFVIIQDTTAMKKVIEKSQLKFHLFLRYSGSNNTGECYIHIVTEGGAQFAISISQKRKDRGYKLKKFSSIKAVYNVAKQLGVDSVVFDMDLTTNTREAPIYKKEINPKPKKFNTVGSYLVMA
jgi:hypothetical protein